MKAISDTPGGPAPGLVPGSDCGGLGETEFNWFRAAMRRHAGVELGPQKKMLVASRLATRLRQLGLSSYRDYVELLHHKTTRTGEIQVMVDLLTTNETYFFREPLHFDFIRQHHKEMAPPGKPLRVWSAACSSGQEPYSLAMLLAELRGLQGWEVLGTDISQRVLETARRGLYSMERTHNIPPDCLKAYCLKGTGPQQGRLLIHRQLRERVSFQQMNLNEPLPELGRFQLILLRNVMIYFDRATKAEIVARVVERLEPGGYLIIGQSETLHGMSFRLGMVRPSIYRKP